MKNLQAMLMTDFYKIGHRKQYPKGTEIVYSTFTPRASRIDGVNEVVNFGLQGFIKEYLIDFFNSNFFSQEKSKIVSDYSRFVKNTLGDQNPETKHIEDLHDLGHLPLEINALPEGTKVPLRVPMFTIHNTDSRFFWLTNFLETLMSCNLWVTSTSATIANRYKKLLNEYAIKTTGSTDFVQFQGHDFSMRGMSSLSSSVKSGAAHLLSFVGTDTIPAIGYLEEYYGANIEKELVGCSVPATEHSVQCAYGNDLKYFDNMLKLYPQGIVSIVSDGYDFWKVITEVVPSLKDKILARNGTGMDKVVIRPDSGDPVKIICGDPDAAEECVRKGAVECLWDTFGGTTTEQGYKVLDSHIGLIYGDAITYERCKEICENLEKKGFASVNLVYGIGSYTYQMNTRDTFGFALKSTLCKVSGEEKQIYKDPKTDDGIKKSQKGAVMVYQTVDGNLAFADNMTLEESKNDKNLLTTVFKNGKLVKEQTLSEIRNLLND